MKLTLTTLFVAGSVLLGNAQVTRVTPAEQRIAAARQHIASDPKEPEGYNNLALALLSRARETGSSDYDRQAAEAVAAGLDLAPKDFQLRKAHVAVLLDQRDFARARDEARELKQQTPDDATVRGYLARAYMGLGNYDDAVDSAQWMLNLQPFNVPGLLIAADMRQHDGDNAGALEALHRAYAETSPDETGELASIANHIAAIDIDTGKLDAASQMLQRADELFPGYPETIKNRARVGAVHPAPESAAVAVPAASSTTESRPPVEQTAGNGHAGSIFARAGGMVDPSCHWHRARHSNHAEPGAARSQGSGCLYVAGRRILSAGQRDGRCGRFSVGGASAE